MISVIINCFRYVNLRVSEKYETDLTGFEERSHFLQKAHERKLEIDNELNNVEMQIGAGLIITTLLIGFFSYEERKVLKQYKL